MQIGHPEAPADGAATADDLALLRTFEPVVRHTKGELFHPTAVGPYVARCSLWAGGEDGNAERLVPAGELDLERLCEEAVANQARPLSLRFVQEPLDRAAYRRWRRAPRERLVATARFTTTGVWGRVVDAGFRASLLLRGKVAAGLAAAAEVAYREHLEADRFTYYGRVVRDGGYVCLQYWLFYAMNDWRSTFAGVNDHEADWELVVVYLAEQPDAPTRPAWVAFSSHDHAGDELRRRWDDPDLVREGEHPVVFAGAGSHSGAFRAGDYVISVNPPPLEKIIGLLRRAQRLLAPWRDETRTAAGFGIPFVDYARGDGLAVGPGGEAGWERLLIDDETPWVRDFRGLWGLDTEDRFGGERAPAGPRYERDGTPRVSWANPLGWAGLQKVAPDDDAVAGLLADRVATLDRELAELDATIAAERRALAGLRAETRSLDAHDYARALAQTRREETGAREAALNRTVAARTRLADERRTHLDSLHRPQPPEPPQAHLTGPHGRRVDDQERRMRFLRLWSVVSTPLLLVAIIVMLNGGPVGFVATLGVLVVGFLGVEALARRRFVSFLASLVLLAAALALAVGFVLVFREHWRLAVSAVLGAAALTLLFGNLRDVRHGWRRG